MRDSLDRHITGNYGEDQFKDYGQHEAYEEPEQSADFSEYQPSPGELRLWRVVDEALKMAVAIVVKEMGDPEVTEERAAQLLDEAIDVFLDRHHGGEY